MYDLLRMTASGWIGMKKKMIRSQKFQNSTTFKLKLKAGDQFLQYRIFFKTNSTN